MSHQEKIKQSTEEGSVAEPHNVYHLIKDTSGDIQVYNALDAQKIELERRKLEQQQRKNIADKITTWEYTYPSNTPTLIRLRVYSILQLYFSRLSAGKIWLITDLNRSFLNRLLNSNKKEIEFESMNLETLLRFKHVFQVDLNWLLTGEGVSPCYVKEIHEKLLHIEERINNEFKLRHFKFLEPTKNIVKPIN